jgi:hypothetical protein
VKEQSVAMNSFSPAGQLLGLGGGGVGGMNLASDLQDQVVTESEEQRRKRLQQAQQARLLGVTGSAAGASLFGGLGGVLGGSPRGY